MTDEPEININARRISQKMPPYVIAEMSANHNGNLENAYNIIASAKIAGADAIKIQTYRPDTITLKLDTEEFRIRGGLWDGRTLYDLYEEAHLPWEWHKPLFSYARKVGITIFSSPFDCTAVDLLEDLNAPAYKIASFEIVDLPLIQYAASTKKPLIISTGIANAEEIQDAVSAAREAGCEQLALLHCVSGYPAKPEEYNLRTIPDLIQKFNVVTGISDHTIGNTTAISSIGLGSSIIEKHFTLDRKNGGPDDSFSLEPAELKDLCSNSQIAWAALGKIDYGIKGSERENIKFRRSLYFIKNLEPGEIISPESLKSIRPGYGLSPKKLHEIIGKKLIKSVRVGTPLSIDLFE